MSRNNRALENLLYRHIPITKSLGIHVAGYSGSRLVVQAPLAINANHYGTAFAGSIGALLMLGGLAIIRLKLADMGLRAHIMLVKSRILYLHPVATDIEVSCELASELTASRIRQQWKRRSTMNVQVQGGVQAASGIAVKYAGCYAIQALSTDEIRRGVCFC